MEESIKGTFVVKNFEKINGRTVAEMVRKEGLGNLRIVIRGDVKEGDEYSFVVKKKEKKD